MLTPEDDELGHPPNNGEPGWFDRFWVNAHAVDGETTVSQGIGVYGNTGVVDGFAIVVRCGDQRIVRASTGRGTDPRAPRVGPISAEILEPLRRWRFRLEPDERAGIAYDFEFEANFDAIDCGTMREWTHFVQAGNARGRIVVDGEEIVMDAKSWRAGRDRSWGRRPEGRGDANWVCAQTPSTHLWYLTVDDDTTGAQRFVRGWMRSRNGVDRLVRVDRRPTFDAAGAFREAEIEVEAESGAKRTFAFRRLGSTVFLRGGLYNGWRGHLHGDRRGEIVESERWNVADPATLGEVAGLNDHVSEVRSEGETGHGIFELTHGK